MWLCGGVLSGRKKKVAPQTQTHSHTHKKEILKKQNGWEIKFLKKIKAARKTATTEIMGPPSKRKTKRRSRSWSSQLGFLFFSMLFLLLSTQRNIVNADTDDATDDPLSTLSSNITSTNSGLNTNGEICNQENLIILRLFFDFSAFFDIALASFLETIFVVDRMNKKKVIYCRTFVLGTLLSYKKQIFFLFFGFSRIVLNL